jgi:ketosteroid isomerase-like protein
MTRPDLSPAITEYFDLMDGPDKMRVAEVFTTDAVVVDDGHTYRGREAILGWLTGPASEYTTTSTWKSAEQSDTTAVVIILLEGDFPGGRVELRYEFEQEPDGLISTMSITAR